jgi:integrase
MSTMEIQKYFSSLQDSELSGETILKMKEVLSSVMASAVLYDFIPKNPMLAVKIPRAKVVNKQKTKPNISPEEFERLMEMVAEPYCTMICTAVFSGLRVSELLALKWQDVHDDGLTVDERFCRGDWSIPKTKGSAATVGVPTMVIARIRRLKDTEVEINWGGQGARKRIKLVRKDGPEDLVFPSFRNDKPMRDQNILRRHLRPAAIALGIDPKKATWRSLRTSCASWMSQAGAKPKDIQGQMRHSRISTTMEIYAQHNMESQQRAVAKMLEMVESRTQSTAVN